MQEKNISKKRICFSFFTGFFGSALIVWLIGYVLGLIPNQNISQITFIILIFAYPLFITYISFNKIDNKTQIGGGRYAAIGALTAFALMLIISVGYLTGTNGYFAGVCWAIAYGLLLAAIPFMKNRPAAGYKENFLFFATGLASGGLIWKLIEFVRGGAIYPILAVEWLAAAVSGIVTRRRIIIFAIVIMTVIFLWYAMLSDFCGFPDRLRW